MVYLGLQDDDEYGAGYDQYGYGHDDGYGAGVPQGPVHEDPYAHHEPRHAPEPRHGGPGGEYAEVGAAPRAFPESRDVRPLRDVQPTPAPRDPYASPEPTVRPVPREEPPSGVTVNRPSVVRAVPTTAARVHVVEPHGFNDAPEIGDRVKENQAVILNLQGVSRELQRRLIDFSSGLAYAVGGSMSRVAESVFLISPLNVQLSEEEKERLEARGLYRRD
jgi:cell division inhibitor SepF